jgi:hypothetical protein
MKRLVFFILSAVFLFSLTLGIVNIISQDVDAFPCEKCHLVWDTVDKMFYCVGSASNCCCDCLEEQ